ncbi:PREDICTED: neuromodulin-like, partial [Priapulus caudatus]|uniref:Neuromodulin-like n=1 Tax=Priapulus caudatus TaxID=37621 RepID=A0ABM1F420_PRICU
MQTLRVLVFALLVALLSAAPVAEDGATVEKINAIFSDEDAPPVVEGTAAADTILEEAANSDDQEEEEEEEQEQEQEANDIAGIVETEELDIPEEEQETD